ncbi:MAG TPA: hypothetical protein VMW50_03090 [Dehalococcoidia bacterium]|nr:hypothetical protein [Dehalococcoidia bacterium]
MVDCEFLYHEVKKTCTNCRGWFCLSRGSRKKLLDTAMCTDEEAWIECPRYLEVHPELEPEVEVIELPPTEEVITITGVDVETIRVVVEPEPIEARVPTSVPSSDCPYLGPIPEGEHGCCDYWCYAKDERLRSVKSCKSRPSWRECMRRLKAEKAGVKYALG